MIKVKFPLILASKSPRRQQLLREAGFEFTIQIVPVEETYPEDLEISEIPVYLAKKKANAVVPVVNNAIIISADTIVTWQSTILGKPKSVREAQEMLKLLSGKTHQVHSGVCIAHQGQCHSFADRTEVTFKPLKINEIDYYIEHYAPMDKAGAYGIQEWIGLIGIEKISGSYFNVVGLPVEKLYRSLQHLDLLDI
jgi:septum formation protein